MSDLVEKIRAGLVADAGPEVRAAGAAACRCALAMIEPSPAAALPPDALPKLVGMLRGMDLDQVLTVAVERLRAASAARGDVAKEQLPRAINFQMVPVPRALTGGS
jgi:hypothetical protein